MGSRTRAAATAAALFALVLLAGSAAFLAAREDPTPPTTTSTTTTSTTVPVAEVADAIAASLQADLTVAVTRAEATCVATALLAVLPPEQLERLGSLAEPLAALRADQRRDLVRAVVRCVPPESAAALLGNPSTTVPPVDLPDEGG
jgi:hypothetical protein